MPTLWCKRPRLVSDGLDHVIAVQALKRFEVVKGSTGATRAAHVHVDDGEPEQCGDCADAALRPGGIGVAVAGVLDQRRIWPLARRKTYIDGQLGAIARAKVAVAIGGDVLGVELRARRRGAIREHGDGTRDVAPIANLVTVAGLDLAEQQSAERVDTGALHRCAVRVYQRQTGVRRRVGDVDLLGATGGDVLDPRASGGGGRSPHPHAANSKTPRSAALILPLHRAASVLCTPRAWQVRPRCDGDVGFGPRPDPHSEVPRGASAQRFQELPVPWQRR